MNRSSGNTNNKRKLNDNDAGELDLFQVMNHAAKRNKGKTTVEYRNKQRKAARIIEEARNLNAMNAQNHQKNVSIQKRAKKTKISEVVSDHSSLPVPSDLFAKEYPYRNDNSQDLDLMLFMVDVKELPINQIDPSMVTSNRLPYDEHTSRTNLPPIRDFGSDDREYKKQLKLYRKGPTEINVNVPVLRFNSILDNGCTVVVNVHGVYPEFIIPVPKKWASIIITSTFNLTTPNHRIQLPKDQSVWKETFVSRNKQIASNNYAIQYCEQLRHCLEKRLQNDCLEKTNQQYMKWFTGDFTSKMIIDVKMTLEQDSYGYNHDEQIAVFHITCALGSVKRFCKSIFTEGQGLYVPSSGIYIKLKPDEDLYNFSLPLETQLLVNHNLAGFSWFTVPSGKYTIKTGLIPEEERHCNLNDLPYRYQDNDVTIEDARNSVKQNASEIMEEWKLADPTEKDRMYTENVTWVNEDGTEEVTAQIRTTTDNDNDNDNDNDDDITIQNYMNELNAEEESDEKKKQYQQRKTWLRAEIDVHIKDLISHHGSREPRWEKLPNMQIVAFDIECLNRKGSFPKPGIRKIINNSDGGHANDDEEITELVDPGDPVCMISIVCKYLHNPGKKRLLLTWKIPKNGTDPNQNKIKDYSDCNDLSYPDTKIFMYEDEIDMLKGFADILRNMQPHFLTGYNIYKFDLPYLLERANVLEIKTFCLLGSYREPAIVKETIKQSSAMGQQQRSDFFCGGLLAYDLLRYVIGEMKLKSNTLGFVAQTILGRTKSDLHHSFIPKRFWGNREDRNLLVQYNVIDSELPIDIIEHPKHKIIYKNAEISRVCGVTLDMLLTKGQGVKTESQLYRVAKEYGFIIPNRSRKNIDIQGKTLQEVIDFQENGDNDEFMGAWCLPPVTGFHDKPIATEDFQSLYPSIIIAWNICYSTNLLCPEEDLKRIPPEFVEKVQIKDKSEGGGKVIKEFYYVKRGLRQGLLCLLVEKLLNRRNKEVKGQIREAEAKGESTDLLEARSLAIKLAANSAYGYPSAYKYYCPRLSESVCALGRDLLMKTKDKIESFFNPNNINPLTNQKFEYQAKIIYGDSVTGDTPVLLKEYLPNGNPWITIQTFNQIDHWLYTQTEKQVSDQWNDKYIWSANGWARIKSVIRHETHKKIFRVSTKTGTVDVTEDHSLLNQQGKEIKPNECEIHKTKLLHNYPVSIKKTQKKLDENIFTKNDDNSIPMSQAECQAFVYGVFYANGKIYSKTNRNKWVIKNLTNDVIAKVSRALKIAYPDIHFTYVTKGYLTTPPANYVPVFKLKPTNTETKFVQNYKSIFYNSQQEKQVPNTILNLNTRIQQCFVQGYLLCCSTNATIKTTKGDDDVSNNFCKTIVLNNKGKLGTAGFYYLLKNLGYKCTILLPHKENQDEEEFSLKCVSNCYTDNIDKDDDDFVINNLYEVKNRESEYVYDITTEDHTFQAGIGEIIVHNTDSVMIKFGCSSIKEANEFAKIAEVMCNKMFPPPVQLVFEKVYKVYLLTKKKTYAGLLMLPGMLDNSWILYINSKGPWNCNSTYKTNDGVTCNGSVFVALRENCNSPPPSSDWLQTSAENFSKTSPPPPWKAKTSIPNANFAVTYQDEIFISTKSISCDENINPPNNTQQQHSNNNFWRLPYSEFTCFHEGEFNIDRTQGYKRGNVVSFSNTTFVAIKDIPMGIHPNNNNNNNVDNNGWVNVAGNMYKPKKDCKGLENKRRDKIKFTQRLVDYILDQILYQKPLEDTLKWVRNECEKLCRNELAMCEIIKSKSQKLKYSSKTVQTAICEKKLRREGIECVPKSGDRVYFVPVKVPDKNAKYCDRVDDPMYVKKHNIPIDYSKVGESDVFKSVRRLFKLVISKDDLENKLNYIFEPFKTFQSTLDQKQGGGLLNFATIQNSCKKCDLPLNRTNQKNTPGSQVLCPKHIHLYHELKKEYEEKLSVITQASQKSWLTCRKCVGPTGDPLECSNMDCDVFWERDKFESNRQVIDEYCKKIDLTW